ncbi:hypothetical protein ACP70R_018707 [Stipagrostis hirtigluma subsp. patula]
MDIVLSAFLGEIAQRSISFFIDKLSNSKAEASLPGDENLRRKLLRIRLVVDEAEGRQIRSHAMLEQLKLLQAEMYRGCYLLDTFKYQAYQEDDHGGHGVSHSFALSKFNPAKRIQLSGGSNRGGDKELKQVVDYLEMIITDASEFVVVLKDCPTPLYRRPYSTYLVMEKCMFARHVEMEHIINLLMQKGSPGVEDLDVIPIVGPAKAGKDTLIEHICNDERVRTVFSRIVFFTEDDLDKRLISVTDRGTIKHQSYGSDTNERVLIILRVNGDLDEAMWSNLYSASKMSTTNGGKIIICSWSDKIARFGTTQVVKVECLAQEAYWYFFKALAFGSMDPEEEPELAAMAMEIALGLHGSFIAGNVMARMLRANFSADFWRMVLSCVKEVNQRYCFVFGSQPINPAQSRKQLRILNDSNDNFSFFNDYKIVSAQDEAPAITFEEVWSGNYVPYCGKFDVLAWRSAIPPYHRYSLSCEIHKAPRLDV